MDFAVLLSLHQVADCLQQLREIKVWFDDETCILDDCDERLGGLPSLERRTLVFDALKNERKQFSQVRLYGISIDLRNFRDASENDRHERTCCFFAVKLADKALEDAR